MVDRQDIDALLVGALYGELTPAEEARLAAHLESHPADRSALADLKTAREAVRESRVFDVQHEPPQAISAMLLQEAHRRAPRPAREAVKLDEHEGWFARLARSFLAHPALAAAAMLVLVVGVAGTLYLSKGDQFAGKEVTAEHAEPTTASAPRAQATEQPSDPTSTGAGAGSGYVVGLADRGDTRAPQGAAAPAGPEAADAKAELAKEASKDKADLDQKLSKLSTKPSPAPVHRGVPQKAIAVTTPAPPMPKDLERSSRAKSAADRNGFASLADDGSPSAGAGGQANGPVAGAMRKEPAPAMPKAPAPMPQAAPPPPPAVATTTNDAPAQQAAPAKNAESSALLAWAHDELAKTIAFAKADNCREAAKHALDIRARAPEFYTQNVAYNRQLKSCATYITNAAQQTDDERQQRAKKPAATESVK